MKKFLFGLLLGLFFIAPSFGIWADAYKEKSTGLSLPETLGGMKRGEITDFEKDYPEMGLGVGILYRDANPKIYADIYIYNLGLGGISNGVGSYVVHQQRQQAEGDILALEKRGDLHSLKKIHASLSRLGNTPALRTDFSYVQNGEQKLSHLLMTGYKNNFIKIRFTYPASLRAEGERALRDFTEGLGGLLSK